MIVLNMVWPAIYIAGTLAQFSFFVIFTIVLEMYFIQYMLNYDTKKAFYAALIGNLVSGILGTIVMAIAMLGWHAIADWAMPHATFDIINWVVTFIFMCAGSIYIEVFTIQLIFKTPFKDLLKPLMVGNILTYIFIALTMLNDAQNNEKVEDTQQVIYTIQPDSIMLLDTTKLKFVSATMGLPSNNLIITFEKESPKEHGFDLRELEDTYGTSYKDNNTFFFNFQTVKDTIKLILSQKNPTPGIGWIDPKETDTITFLRKTNN
jgi:hypothetical protein